MTRVQVAVISKAPVPGTVKTRLCPPYTPDAAADLAAAALDDLIAAVSTAPAARRVLLLDGDHPAPRGWDVVAQRGDGLAARLANGYADLARPGLSTLIVAGDAPQVDAALLATATGCLDAWSGAGAKDRGTRRRAGHGTGGRHPVDAVFGPTDDGGFWALGLRHPEPGQLLLDVPMSTATTGERTLAALRAHGLRVALLPQLRDVDTVDDVAAVAASHPHTRFAAAARAAVTSPASGVPDRVQRSLGAVG